MVLKWNRRWKANQWLTGCCLLVSLSCFAEFGYINIKANLAQYLLERAWKDTKEAEKTAISNYAQVMIKPWSWADVYPVAKLGFVRFNTSYLVLNNDSGQALAFGPGLTGRSRIEKQGVNVISAHKDTHFEVLDHIVLGDEISLENKSGVLSYFIVDDIFVIDTEKEQLYLSDSISDDTSELVLITCYPFTSITASTPLRLVVKARELITEILPLKY